MTKKNLAVFDFDHTIVNDNSDTAVLYLIGKDKFQDDLQTNHTQDGWTAYMQQVFSALHHNGVIKENIDDLVRKIPEVDGMKNLVSQLHDRMDYDIIIISDANTYFISLWLEANNINSKVSKIFSNPAQFNHLGLLQIEMYHIQDTCKLSTRNMCKGMIMEDFIKHQSSQGIEYKRIIYVGDGKNDFCPILRLSKTDIACVRKNYKCAQLINNANAGMKEDNGKTNYSIKAHVYFWENGDEILNFLINDT